MGVTRKRSTWVLAGMVWALASGAPSFADDTELFVSTTAFPDAKPNILFILDTSGSMTTPVVTQATYDPAFSYGGACDASRVYWRRGSGNPPNCGTNRWFDRTAFMCDAAMQAFQSAGFYTDRMAQYDPGSDDRWERISSGQKSRLVECQDDSGVHGDGSDVDEVYAQDDDDNQLWSDDPDAEVPWGNSPTDRVYTTYDGNYMNWYYGPTSTSTRIQVMKDVTTNLLDTVNGVNVGLMRFNTDQGGPVIHAMEDIATARGPMQTTINGLPASGWTPLSETLYEAGQYYADRQVDYGDIQGPEFTVASARDPGNASMYNSPMEYGCQKNFVVMLTDGAPTQDVNADAKIEGLPGFNTLVGASCDGSGDGACLDDMAAYMYEADFDSTLPGKQNVVTYTIGFTVDLPILASTAARGGGAYFTANDTASLSTALTSIVTSILDTQTTFTAPTVSVNSFNRTRTLNDMYISMFQASGNTHWPGNLKKYTLRVADSQIVDANGNPAVDPNTGFFDDNARSYWSALVDGSDITAGGAANQLPLPAARNVFTFLGNTDLSAPTNSFDRGNMTIDDAMLGIGGPGDPTRDDLIDFVRGVDVTDVDQDPLTDERNQMGDPLHAQPASFIYGPTVDDAVVFFATNDGNLHAIDPSTGQEKWTFIPPDFLPDLVDLYEDESTPDKHYGIDGSLKMQILANNDGVLDQPGGERAYLYFGMRRGGTFYYGLDVSLPDSPRLMWRLDGTSLPGVGQTWSDPVPARINISGAPYAAGNTTKQVLVIGGGYDPGHDNYSLPGAPDSGNAIYIIDSENGNLLFHASNSGSDKDLLNMVHSFPGDIKVVDLDGDKFADRMYAADMGGQIWRFDVFNGQPAASLVNGGVIAQLGGAPNPAPPVSDTRRFYYTPDVAFVNDDDQSFIHIGVGSGHRARPNSVFAQDRFYAMRDYATFASHTQAYYNTLVPITDAALMDITDDINAVVPIGSAGWRFELRDGGWIGEKVLAEARTFDNKIFFTSFIPGAGATANNCQPALGRNRLYVLDILNGGPVHNLDNSADPDNLTETDRYREFQGSISSEVVFLFPSPDDPACVGDQCTPPPVACVDLFCFPPGFVNNPVRTFWSQESTN